jgi:hypothetical protein
MKRPAARLLFIGGAVAVALVFFRASPRDVTLVYALGDAGAREVEIDIRKAGETVRHAEFRAPHAAQLRHDVRLTDGEYEVRVRVAPGDGPPRLVDRTITVTESGTIVLPVGP